MLQKTVYFLTVAFLIAAVLRIGLGRFPRWLLVGMVVVLLGGILHPRAVQNVTNTLADMLAMLVLLLLSLLGLWWIFKGFGRNKGSS